MRCRYLALAAVLTLVSCAEKAPSFFSEDSPPRLSDWQLFQLSDTQLVPIESLTVFQPSNSLFTDYAHKLRTLWVPENTRITVVDDELRYPVGSILSKTFYYPSAEQSAAQSVSVVKVSDSNSSSIDLEQNRLIETRLLVKREAGWAAFPYVWNAEQTEAFLRVAGASVALSLESDSGLQDFTYFVPNENQCSGCHTTEHPDGEMRPLGAKASQLGEQLSALAAKGWLEQSQLDGLSAQQRISWQDESLPIEERAVEYLNMHCGHCHNPNGAADTSGLNLDGSHTSLVEMGLCKPPVAAGSGAGDALFGIVPGSSTESILNYRLQSVDPAVMMPELGRSLAHEEGVALINQWVDSLSGNCN